MKKPVAKPREAHRKPQPPAPKTSQSGYGHRSSQSGSTTPQGSGRNKAKARPF